MLYLIHYLRYRSRFAFIGILLLAGCSSSKSLQQEKGSHASTRTETFYNAKNPDDSGMWLLPQIEGAVHAELAAKGLNLPSQDFYDPGSPSLNQAIVRINIGEGGGGTGSFVSDKALILTNHHVAYDAIAAASTAKKNYLKEGFYAQSNAGEIPLQNYSLYITMEQKEVTDQINGQLSDTLSSSKRQQQSQKIRQHLISERKANNDDLVVEIDDYWSGNRQFMTVYKVIRDVRLVHAPPESIGKYGGDIDNWQWPRHTGDYSFLRAYVAPDGSSKPYAKSNVPFHPDRHITINAEGILPGDFTMVFGFPGRTYRYESSYAFQFYEDVRNPVLIKSFQAILDALELAADEDAETAVRNASERASIANSLKYFRGIQRGFDKYNIVERRREMEQKFKQWINQNSSRQQKYGQVLPQLQQAYEVASASGDVLYASIYPLNNSDLLQIAGLYSTFQQYLADSTKSNDLDQSKKDSLLAQHEKLLSSINLEAQNLMLSQMLQTWVSLPSGKANSKLPKMLGITKEDSTDQDIQHFLAEQQEESIIYSTERAKEFLSRSAEQAQAEHVDKMVEIYQILLQAYQSSRQNYMKHNSYLQPAQQYYVEGMMELRDDSTEYADANFTLRLSGGRVHGYSPQDGIYYTPFTTFAGMIAKDTGKKPFNAPTLLQQYFDSTQSGSDKPSPYATSGGVQIVNFLSTNDITGGNSGSPVLNANGELVGLAFDGNIEGVVGDYFYDPELNRTISVDVRYILFLLDEFTEADRLLKEMEYAGDVAGREKSAAGMN